MTDTADRMFGVAPAGVVEEDLAGDDQDGDAAALERVPHGDLEHPRQLLGDADQLRVDAALAEELLRVRLLEVAPADLLARDVRGDREHRHPAAVGVEEAVDEVQVPGPQLAAQTASSPVIAASPAAANAADSSWRTCSQAMSPSRRSASVNPLSESPGSPYTRRTPDAFRVATRSAIVRDTSLLADGHAAGRVEADSSWNATAVPIP